MANRNQDYSNQSGSRRYSQEWRDDDSYDEGRMQFDRSRERDTSEQSGSTGRYAGYGDYGRGEYGGGRSGWSGQERYGQSGYGRGGYDTGDYGSGRSRYGYGYGGSTIGRGRYGQENRGDYGYSGSRGWNEPYGEGQQYTSRGDYAGDRGYGEEWTRPQGYGYGGQGNFSGESGGQEYFTGERSGQGYGASQGYIGSQQGMGEHRGKGPKGYQRSDERIKEMVCERLRDDPAIDPSEVTITVQGGKVTLEGSVDSRQTKNAIEEIAEQFGTQEVQNNLRVQRMQPGTQSSTETGKQGRSPGDDTGSSKQKQH